MLKKILLGLPLLLCACVTTTNIQPDGVNGYRVMSVGDTGFSNSGSMQMKLYNRATSFCEKQGLTVETIETSSQQARPLGGWPQAMLRFKCVRRAT